MRKRNSRDRPGVQQGARAKVFSVLQSVFAIMLVILAVGALSSVFTMKKGEAELPEEIPGVIEPSVPDEPDAPIDPDEPTGPVVEVIIPSDPEGDTPLVSPGLEWE